MKTTQQPTAAVDLATLQRAAALLTNYADKLKDEYEFGTFDRDDLEAWAADLTDVCRTADLFNEVRAGARP